MHLPTLGVALLSVAFAHAALTDHLPNSLQSKHTRHVKRLEREREEARGRVERSGNVTEGAGLVKRGFSGKATFYAPGYGACGGSPDTASSMIVALNVGQYGGGGNDVSQYCFKKVAITYGSKTEYATITDCCMGCNYGDLDMSPSLFTMFAQESVGVFYMSWEFADGSGGGGGGGGGYSSSSPKPSPTSYWKPSSSSSQWTPSTSYAATSSSSSSAYSSSASHSGSLSANGTSSSSGVPPPGATGAGGGVGQPAGLTDTSSWQLEGGNLDRVNQVVMGLGNLVAQVVAQIYGGDLQKETV